MHKGYDFAAPEGSPIYATGDGIIVKKEFNEKGHGKYIIIQHNQTFATFYSHMSEFNIELNDQVKTGDVIGYVGSTGLSTGPHLHYEIRENGEAVNPKTYMK